ncbi:uncharacterized protein [Littorina saxatilis]|uniref:Multiple epidermal growth factor-like domains protein 6 n=1 Tax=Littorina saxatilis TaxID=31220 RepID=A0AAN9G3U4_9CAEN
MYRTLLSSCCCLLLLGTGRAAVSTTVTTRIRGSSYGVFRSCNDVLQASKQQGHSPPSDGEYLLTLPQNVSVSVYCKGFASGTPREYLTLVSGRSTNFAEIYMTQGTSDQCQAKYPETFYVNGGHTEFYRVRLDPSKLTVDLHDPTFAVVSLGVPVSYGTAGDLYARTADCGPMGQFSVDLRGTPFTLSPTVSWRWDGHYADGSTNGQPQIHKNAYIGCFEDAGDRLLPTSVLKSGAERAALTPDTCSTACAKAGFSYSGVENKNKCFCGDSYTKHRRATESSCNTACSGDRTLTCGGSWRISVYATDKGQTVRGRCGGFPAKCYPVVGSSPQPAMQLALAPSNPCLHGVCQHNEMCVALSAESFKCVPKCNGTSCDADQHPVVSNTVDCPMGLLPIQCGCATNTCTGARFNGDRCLSSTGKSRVTCIHEDPGHVQFTDAEGKGSARCPNGTQMVGCSYWDSANHHQGNGAGVMASQTNSCSVPGCTTCTVYARCQAFVCGCENGATCNPLTGQCVCPPGYYGDQCDTFDYCSYYEDHKDDHSPACSAGTCQAVPSKNIRTYGASSQSSGTCVFPFSVQVATDSISPLSSVTYTQCVDDDLAGPPFACGTYFDGVDDYIDLGVWSPGAVYTLSAWVSPAISDNTRRIILGAGWNCRDFGLILQNGRFNALYSPTNKSACTANLQGPTYTLHNWYLVTVTNNGTHATLYVGDDFVIQTPARPFFVPTSESFRMGNSKGFKEQTYKGYIKSVKIWKRSLELSEIQSGMSAQGMYNSTNQALNQGLVAHYELGNAVNISCVGTDHGGDDWTLLQDQEVSGVHCNVNRMMIGQGITVQVAPYDGLSGGFIEVYAEAIHIDGYLTAEGRGYWGGQRPTGAGADGQPGESYHSWNGSQANLNLHVQFYQPHRGGGGGGQGGTHGPHGMGSPGGGGGYGMAGGAAKRGSSQKGQGGLTYGSAELQRLYMGSGGGSGGNAKDLAHSPPGGRGGNGGGAIGLYARGTVQIHGHVSVAGEGGQGDTREATGCALCPAACSGTSGHNCNSNSTSACWDTSGPGGGGSGGSLYIRADVVDVGWDKLWLQGGSGGLGGTGGCGGDGGTGRVRVDAVTFRGDLPVGGKLSIANSTTSYQDLSVPGQKQIHYSSALVYGNEIFRGCYKDTIDKRHFAMTLKITDTIKRQMTPQFCIQQCRQNGYAFSAVELGFECYCDNALQLSLITHENECGQACKGDPRQTCGAANRMSVYGPKSFLPALGYNGALQKCRPWCLTGNLYSPEPSWGYCDLSSQTSISYTIRCQCPAGFQGTSCDQACPAGTWGLNCGKLCICNNTNTLHCNPQDGSCDCRPGYEGATCDLQCPSGTFGLKCSGHCSCSETSDCDFATGKCSCKPGWKGDKCQFPCPQGTYGLNCSHSCQCFQGSCDPEDGTCSCDTGYKLPFCSDTCDPSNYGPNCMSLCDCHNQPCDAITGMCKCNPGYDGRRCEKLCPHGTFGADCGQQCQCQNDAACDHVTGECDCGAGWVGEQCELPCPPNQYGMDCEQKCVCAVLNMEACDAITGLCYCKPGYTGDACQQKCDEGYWGNCASRCDCYNKAPCDKRTGQCQCLPGFTGPQCQTACQDTTYGANCSQSCPPCSTGICSKVNGSCVCPGGSCSSCPSGLFGIQCDQVCQCEYGTCHTEAGQTYTCQCDPGWQGLKCDTPCPAGTYGTNCLSACQCVHGNCSTETGYCTCDPGFIGESCQSQCPTNTYGVLCSGNCQPCGPGALTDDCDPVSGQCVCKPGYFGALCDRPCPENTYGDKCTGMCNCINGDCDNVDGSCECVPGYGGDLCDQKCRHGTWGPDCMNNCSCSGHWTSCEVDTGQCQCAAGFTGIQCRQSCPVGTFGTNCADQCTCDATMAQCSPIDGSCLCLPGFYGPNCDQPCSNNTYGVNCSQRCDCSGHGGCDNQGVCDCEPGYGGDHCLTQCEEDAKWGKNCRSTCDCSDQHCDFRDGLCRCDPGKQGRRCDQSCDADHFGFQCAQLCECKNGATCDPETGECHCPTGIDGRYCNQSCPVGKYGVGCGQSCPCSPDTACDRKTGQCQCQPGFKGPACNITCPDGTWDVNCAMKCSSTCHAGCLPDTGQCKCTAGSCPPGYSCQPSGLCDTAAALTSPNTGGGLSGGQTAGIVVGFILGLVVVGLAVFFFMHKRNTAVVNRLFAIFKSDTNGSTSSDSSVQGSDNPLYHSQNQKAEPSRVSFELDNRDSSKS